MLNDIKKSYSIVAARLPKRYEEYTIDELADGYCKAVDTENTLDQGSYFAGLLLRFWYKIDRLYNENKQFSQDREEFYSWLVDAILYACKYRGWQKKDSKTNAQSCINKCITTIRLQHIYDANLDKNKANINTVSFDQPMRESSGENDYDALADVTEDESESPTQIASRLNAESIIQHYIDRNKIIESVILDIIAFSNCEKETKKMVKQLGEDSKMHKYSVKGTQFWRYSCIKQLAHLPKGYAEYFANRYKVDSKLLLEGLNKIQTSNNTKLYSYLNRTLENAKVSAQLI